MALTAVTGANVAYLSKNVGLVDPAGQSVTTGNTAVLTPQAPAAGVQGLPFKGRYVLVRMVASAASTVTFKAGDVGGTPANLAASGDLVVTFAGAGTQLIQVELSRFAATAAPDVNGNKAAVVNAVVGGTGPVAFTVFNLSKAA